MLDQTSSQTLESGKSGNQIGFLDARENFQNNSNWWTVFATFNMPDFNPSTLWISKRANLPVEEVVEALEGLTSLGYLTKTNDSFVPVKGKEFLSFDWSGKSKAEIIDQHALVSQQILNHLHPATTVVFDHRFFASNIEIVTQLYKDINSAFEKAFLDSQANKSKNDGIYKITFTAVDVLKAPIQGEGK